MKHVIGPVVFVILLWAAMRWVIEPAFSQLSSGFG